MTKKLSVLIGSVLSDKVEYYLALFNEQTSRDFRMVFLSEHEPDASKFNFEFMWVKEHGRAFQPNIRRMRHACYKNELLLAIEADPTPYVLMFDAYQIPTKRLVEEHIKYLAKGYAVVGSRIETFPVAEEWQVGVPCTVSKSDPRYNGREITRIDPGSHWDCNASCAYEDMLKVNGYDMHFMGGGGGEDCDKAIRIARTGRGFVYNYRALMYHPNHDTMMTNFVMGSQKDRAVRFNAQHYHTPYKFRASPWDPVSSGDDALMEDECLVCHYDEKGFKYWRCKACGEEGLVDSVHVHQWNEAHKVVRTDFGMNELREWIHGSY